MNLRQEEKRREERRRDETRGEETKLDERQDTAWLEKRTGRQRTSSLDAEPGAPPASKVIGKLINKSGIDCSRGRMVLKRKERIMSCISIERGGQASCSPSLARFLAR